MNTWRQSKCRYVVILRRQGTVGTFVCFLLRAKLGDAVAQDHEALVDVVGLLQRLAFALGLLGHLTPGQVHKVDLAVPGDVHSLQYKVQLSRSDSLQLTLLSSLDAFSSLCMWTVRMV